MLVKIVVLLFVCFAFGDEDQTLFSKFFQHDYDIKDIRVGSLDYNKKLIHDLSFGYRKYNRTTKALNLTCLTLVDLTLNNTSAVLQAYKRYGNEFKEFAIRFPFKYCQALRNEIIGIGTSTSRNFSCPIKKNVRYTIYNWIPDFSRLPPLIPDGEYMVHLNVTYDQQYLFNVSGFGTVYRQVKIPN